MAAIRCFLIEPTDREARWLRRYRVGSTCATCEQGYHQAWVRVEDGRRPPGTGDGPMERAAGPDSGPHAEDPRWPSTYPCGEPVVAHDARQVFTGTIYRRAGTGETWPLRDVPPGAMWDASRLAAWRGPDGRCWMVRTPGGDWCIDGPATRGGRWRRTGTAPRLTVTPSIGQGPRPDGSFRYHGWLREGVLVDA